jgi:hypothetical protein
MFRRAGSSFTRPDDFPEAFIFVGSTWKSLLKRGKIPHAKFLGGGGGWNGRDSVKRRIRDSLHWRQIKLTNEADPQSEKKTAQVLA